MTAEQILIEAIRQDHKDAGCAFSSVRGGCWHLKTILRARYSEKEVPLTTTKAAAVCGISSSTFLRAVQAKKIKSHRTPGGHYRVTLADVRAFMGGSTHA